VQETMPSLAKINSTDTGKHGRVYTVSEITRDIKIILENSFAEVWLEGESL